jgi:hypothetical protein
MLGAAPANGQASASDSVRSPTLRQLEAQLLGGNAAVRLAAFWSTLRGAGTPLVEPTARPGYRLVTFVFRGGDDVARVRLDAGLNALLVKSVRDDDQTLGLLRRLAGTDVWFLSIELRADLRAPYRFLVTRTAAPEAHFAAGWRSAGFGVMFALAMQALVWLSDGLLLAVLTHAVYDLIAAWLGHRLAARTAA